MADLNFFKDLITIDNNECIIGKNEKILINKSDIDININNISMIKFQNIIFDFDVNNSLDKLIKNIFKEKINNKNIISSKIIFENCEFNKSINIENMLFIDDLDLNGVKFKNSLDFNNCELCKNLNINFAYNEQTDNFLKCVFKKYLSLNNINVKEKLNIEYAIFSEKLNISNSFIKNINIDEVFINAIEFNKNQNIDNFTISNTKINNCIDFQCLIINENLSIYKLVCLEHINLEQLRCNYLKIEKVTINKYLNCKKLKTEELYIEDSKINKYINLTNTNIDNLNFKNLALDEVDFSGIHAKTLHLNNLNIINYMLFDESDEEGLLREPNINQLIITDCSFNKEIKLGKIKFDDKKSRIIIENCKFNDDIYFGDLIAKHSEKKVKIFNFDNYNRIIYYCKLIINNTLFNKNTGFGKITFKEEVEIKRSEISEKIDFKDAIFEKQVNLIYNTINNISFNNSTLNNNLKINYCTIKDCFLLPKLINNYEAEMMHSIFKDSVSFAKDTNIQLLNIEGSIFEKNLLLLDIKKLDKIKLKNCQFYGYILDIKKLFYLIQDDEISFENVIFKNNFSLTNTNKITHKLNFKNTHFLSNFEAKKLILTKEIIFENTQFDSDVNFSESKFQNVCNIQNSYFKMLNFIKAEFCSDLMFKNNTINENANFSHITTHKNAIFTNAIFKSDVNFTQAKFNSLSKFDSTNFYSSLNLYMSNFNLTPDFSGAIISNTSSVNLINISLQKDSFNDIEYNINEHFKYNQQLNKESKILTITKIRDTYRVFKNILLDISNNIDASYYQKMELFTKEIENEQKIKEQDKNRLCIQLDTLILKFYRLTSEHHTNLLLIMAITFGIIFSHTLNIYIIENYWKNILFNKSNFKIYNILSFASIYFLAISLLKIYNYINLKENSNNLIKISILTTFFWIVTYFIKNTASFLYISLILIFISTLILIVCLLTFKKTFTLTLSIILGIICIIYNFNTSIPISNLYTNKSEQIFKQTIIYLSENDVEKLLSTMNIDKKNIQENHWLKKQEILKLKDIIITQEQIINKNELLKKSKTIDNAILTINVIYNIVILLCIYSLQKTARRNTTTII